MNTIIINIDNKDIKLDSKIDITESRIKLIDTIVKSIVKKSIKNFNSSALDKDDIYQSGWLGALIAYNKFIKLNEYKSIDSNEIPKHNLSDKDFFLLFYKYSNFFIYSEVMKAISLQLNKSEYLYKNNTLHIFNKIKQFANNYNNQYNKFPDDDIIIKKFNVDKDIYCKRIKPYLLKINEIKFNNLSDIMLNNKDLLTNLDISITDNIENKIYTQELITKITEYVDKYLDERSRDIFKRYFGLKPYNKSYTYTEIAKEYQLSKERIRQIVKKNLIAIKQYMQPIFNDSNITSGL
jgi:RNA polymerase sigma factor (sigma-70 family)